MSDIQITMSPGESSAMEKNRAEKEKLQRTLALLDRELRERCDELSKLGFEMCQMDKHNQEYTTGDSVLMRNQSKISTASDSTVANCVDEDDFYELESESLASGHFSTHTDAYVKQIHLKKDPKYKELKKFTFEDMELFKEYMRLIDERTVIEEKNQLLAKNLKAYRSKDPLFATRHAHHKYLKACRKPPIFAFDPILVPIVTQKTIDRQLQEIISEKRGEPEMTRTEVKVRVVDAAVRTFLQNFHSDFNDFYEKK